MLKPLCLAIATALALPMAVAHAQSKPAVAKKSVPMVGHTQDVMKFVDAFDSNMDKVLTSDEHEAWRRKHFVQTDTSGDGYLNMPEYVGEFESRLDERFAEGNDERDHMTEVRFVSLAGKGNNHITRERFDTSGEAIFKAFASGKLPEKAGAPSANSKDVLRMPTTHSLEGMMALYDRNGDRDLPREEFDAVRDEQFKNSDVNRDGRLSRDEYAAEFQQRVQHRIHDLKVRQLRQARVRFGILDTDKDDRISMAEFLTSSQRAFNGLDRNNDGRLDAADAALPPKKRPASTTGNNNS